MGQPGGDHALLRADLAQYVIPHFQDSAVRPAESMEWVSREPARRSSGAAGGAIMSAIQKHAEEKAAKSDRISP